MNTDPMETLREKRKISLQMGGKKALESQKSKGKLNARQRLALFFDKDTFEETDRFASHRSTNFGMENIKISGDGVVTGHGLVNGRPVFAYAQDFTSMAGSLGEVHSKKICKIMDLALKSGVPFVGFNDSGGARIQEGIDSLAGFGEIFFRNSAASGVIPQISAIMGPTAGGAVYSPAMTDFVFMVKKTSYMFITGPDVVKSVTGEETDFETLGGADAHCTKSGVSHFGCESDEDAIEKIKELLSYLPSNNMEDPPLSGKRYFDPKKAMMLDSFIPEKPNAPYDMKEIIKSIFDNHEFFEPHEFFGPNIITCFARLDGKPVGIIANQPLYLAGCLDIDSSDKAARFIRFCDCFNFPIITIADVPGFLPGTGQEWGGIIRHGAKMLWSYSEATVPKLLLITRKNYGGAYIAMSSKHLGADLVFAWPGAEIAVMGAAGAAEIIHRKSIKASENPEEERQKKIKEYQELFSNPYIAASRGYVDDVIFPSETREKLVKSLNILMTKKETRPFKKHGNIPL
ncbi:MAG: acyl-CoA carboxylase subunit beta [Desulforegulaceae bacterium]|nr:acyl-CoA carboxylase subunit beta [Desulforegulaceae bacterium]